MNIEQCEKARLSRDARFDGTFFTAVLTTGIFCRPVCPARAPKPENVRYYKTAAQALNAGFVPCKRCLPEQAPALNSSQDGEHLLQLLSHSELSIADIARYFDLSERQLHRKTLEIIGISPLKYRLSQKLLFAQNLLRQTSLSVTDACFASGFNSLRQFNHAFAKVFHCAPSSIRRNTAKAADNTLTITLPYRPPYHWQNMLNFMRQRAIAHIEQVTDSHYRRCIKLGESSGWFEVSHLPQKQALAVTINLNDYSHLREVIRRIRRMFDLDCNWQQIYQDLSADLQLKQLMDETPGLRLPGTWDVFEFSLRAILGQQISVKAATTLASRIIDNWGESRVIDGKEIKLFPEPSSLLSVDFSQIGVTKTRNATLQNWVQFYLNNSELFATASKLTDFITTLCQQPGIGDWTANYLAMRGMSYPDAFPAADLGLLKVFGLSNKNKEVNLLRQRSEQWRPWRAYATIYLWQQYAQEQKS